MFSKTNSNFKNLSNLTPGGNRPQISTLMPNKIDQSNHYQNAEEKGENDVSLRLQNDLELPLKSLYMKKSDHHSS